MKAVIFAVTVLLGIDVGRYDAAHVRGLRADIVAFCHSIGEWVYTPG